MGTNEKSANQEEKIICLMCKNTGEVMVLPDRMVGDTPTDAVFEACPECYPPKEEDYDEWRDNQE